MAELLRLDLHSTLHFRAMEAGESGAAAIWPLPPLEEGAEELFAFDAGEAVVDHGDEGPTILRPLPAARFHGRGVRASAVGVGEGGDAAAGAPHRLDAGEYAFVQFQAAGQEELLEAMNDFVRDCWWEGLRVEGPLYLRRIGEDGSTALQLLRKAEGVPGRAARYSSTA